MRSKLPFLVSIPHGGTTVPEELAGLHSLSAGDILDDIDAFTPSLYDLEPVMEAIQVADIARPFVDLNRSIDQLPPAFPDGVIKSETCQRVPVYHTGSEPDAELIEHLLARYHVPYHAALSDHLRQPDIRLMLDCHSMSDYPPPIAADRTVRRPLVNLGDLDGNSCPPEVTALLAKAFVTVFNLAPDDVSINRPFRGGYITRNHGNGTKPVIQIELNRVLYLDPTDPRKEDVTRISDIRDKIESTFTLFHRLWTKQE